MRIKIFNEYVAPLLKDINNTALIQEGKLNLDVAVKTIDANLSKPSDKK